MKHFPLNWNRSLTYPGMVRFSVPGDGSCLIHSVLCAGNFYGYWGLSDENRSKVVRIVRDHLASELEEIYFSLGRGTLSEISKNFPEYTLQGMQKTLRSTESLDYMFFEVISKVYQVNLIILDGQDQDLLLTGEEDLYQSQSSWIVILFNSNHYEPIGIKEDNGAIRNLFEPGDEFIRILKSRENHLRSKVTSV